MGGKEAKQRSSFCVVLHDRAAAALSKSVNGLYVVRQSKKLKKEKVISVL